MNKNKTMTPFVTTFGFLFFLIFSLAILLAPFQTLSAKPAAPLRISNPEVRLLQNGSAVISWQTPELSSGRVDYGTRGFDQYVEHSGLYKDHAVVITDLQNYTLYHYRITSATSDQSAQSAHLLFWSHKQADLTIDVIDTESGFTHYANYAPEIERAFELELSNAGEVIINKPFYVSVLISEDTSDITASSLYSSRDLYSCFKEVEVTETIAPQSSVIVQLPERIFDSCDVLAEGRYRITVAADYNNDVKEGNELNNVAGTSFVALAETDVDFYRDVEVVDSSPYASTITFAVGDVVPGTITLWYDTEEYIKSGGSYRWSRSVVQNEDGTLSAQLKGLSHQTHYVYMFEASRFNARSAQYSFATPKDLEAEERQLISLKRQKGYCRTVEREPLLKRFWSKLGLEIPEHTIERYRIQWSSGIWSPWYTPGSGDIDWVTLDDQQRRVWSYFDDHRYQYITCNPNSDAELVDPTIVDSYVVRDEPQVLGVYFIKTDQSY